MASGSFSFCDIDVKTLGLEYAPDMDNTYIYKPAVTNIHIETYEGHNGGYAYGAWKQPKDFTLRCFFEDDRIDRGIMSQIYYLFKVGRSGKLVFEKRPWCYYYATVTEPIEEDFTNYRNGLITIHLKAMYPFARSEIMTNILTDDYHEDLMNNSAVFDKEGMELPLTYNLTAGTTNPILLVNPGTERAALGFSISGNVGAGVTISNTTTEQSCKMVAISKAVTTNVNKKVYVDPISGKTTIGNDSARELGFLYHQYGFLELEPSFPCIRDVYISNNRNVTRISSWNSLPSNIVGMYVFIQNKWRRITQWIDEHTFSVSEAIVTPGKERTTIIMMNEITVTPDTDIDITLNFIYKPTYA